MADNVLPADQPVAPGPPPFPEMSWIPSGIFRLGSADFYPEEAPVHRVSVEGFWMDRHPVTAADFRRFVRDTGHVTEAERLPDSGAVSGRRPGAPRPGLARLPEAARPGRARRCSELVGVRAGGDVEAAGRKGNDDQRS